MTRELALALLALAYVAFAAARSGAGGFALVVMAGVSALFVAVYRKSQVPAGSDRVSATARKAGWLTALGIALFVIARSGGAGHAGLDAAVTEVNAATLAAAGLIRADEKTVKILGDGEITRALKVTASKFTASAKAKIEKAGGQAIVA